MTTWGMDTGHCTVEDFLDVYEGRKTLEDLCLEKLGHGLAHCPECGLAVAQAMADLHGIRPDQTADIRRLEILRDVGELGEEGLKRLAREEADALLTAEPMERRRLLEAEPERFGLPVVVDELLDRCEAQLTKDAGRALELAELAVVVSLSIDPAIFHDLAYYARARAEAHRANSLRLHDETRSAEEAFRQAHRVYREAADTDSRIEAELLRLEASLAVDQRRFDDARVLLTSALVLYRQLGTPRPQALTLLKRAHAAYQQGLPARGLEDLQFAARVPTMSDDLEFQWNLLYSTVLFTADAGLVEDAQCLYHTHRDLLESRTEPFRRLRVVWLKAKLAHAGGELAEARNLYKRGRDGFLREGMGYDAALVSLELSVLCLAIGDIATVKQLAAEMMPIFQAQDVHREAMAAIRLFQHAARTEELSKDFVCQLHRYLQLARRDPTLKLADFSEPRR